MKVITSTANSLFKDIKKLLNTKGVKKSKAALCFGERATKDVILNHPELVLGQIRSPDQKSLDVENETLFSETLFREIDIFQTKHPILIYRIPDIENWTPAVAKPKDIFALLPFQDPGNLGTCLRSAAAFGIKKIILTEDSAFPFSPKVTRAASGCHLDLQYFLSRDLNFGSINIFGLDASGKNISEIKIETPFIIAAGIEGKGLYSNLKHSQLYSIPIRENVESLNASIATSIAFFEISKKIF